MGAWSLDEERTVEWDDENPLVVDRDDDARAPADDDRLREERPPHWE